MDDCGIPFSFRTCSAVGESAFFVARQSIYFDLFAALLNFGKTPPSRGTPRMSMRMRLLPDFCTQETKRGLFGRRGACLGTPTPSHYGAVVWKEGGGWITLVNRPTDRHAVLTGVNGGQGDFSQPAETVH